MNNVSAKFPIHAQRNSRVAIIGAGAAGLTATYLMQQKYDVTLFEKDSHLGGHAHTVLIEGGSDVGVALDIGFMVFNDRNYPTFCQMLSRLGIDENPDSEMSFGYYSKKSNTQYAINWSQANQITKRVNLSSPSAQQPNKTFMTLLKDILKFCTQAQQDLNEDHLVGLTLGDYLDKKQYSQSLIDCYLLPMGAAIWSSSRQSIVDFPAESFLRFLYNHGLLSLKDIPQWKYVKGGSQKYVQAILRNFTGKVETNLPIESIHRQDDVVIIKSKDREDQVFDYVVIAAHADEALTLISDPSENERRLLGAWKYQINHALLHTDESVMPPDPTVWASWNYRTEIETDSLSLPCISYHLNRLQGHNTIKEQYFITLNQQKGISLKRILQEIKFAHPIYTFESIKTQKELAALNGSNRTYFCGSYFGYGFHEDAVKSGLAVARLFGIDL